MELASVVMSVHNEDVTLLREAINSILGQSFKNFEFLITDDTSDIPIEPIVNEFNDPRIRLFKNKQNLGLTRSLNLAIARAQGEYIIRQDSDDSSYPLRFETQLHWMISHPEVVVMGGKFVERLNGREVPQRMPFVEMDSDIRKSIRYFNPFAHSTVVFKKKAFDQVGGYNSKYKYAQDHELWVRLLEIGQGRNLPELFVRRSFKASSISVRKEKTQLYFSLCARLSATLKYGVDLKGIGYLIRSLGVLLLPKALVGLLRAGYRK